jgi:hypothetical protein
MHRPTMLSSIEKSQSIGASCFVMRRKVGGAVAICENVKILCEQNCIGLD